MAMIYYRFKFEYIYGGVIGAIIGVSRGKANNTVRFSVWLTLNDETHAWFYCHAWVFYMYEYPQCKLVFEIIIYIEKCDIDEKNEVKEMSKSEILLDFCLIPVLLSGNSSPSGDYACGRYYTDS